MRYSAETDVALAEHADASVLTLNANLGLPGFTGGALAFRGTRFVDRDPQKVAESEVDFAAFSPGDAILHLGGTYHSARPITAGERVNLVLWMFAEHGVVRVAPYDEGERVGATDRWDRRRRDAVEGAVAGFGVTLR